MLAVLSNGSASLVLLHCFFPKDPCTCMYLFDVMHDWLHPHVLM